MSITGNTIKNTDINMRITPDSYWEINKKQ